MPRGPGWQHYKPSAIPVGDATKVHEACAAVTEVQEFQRLAEGCRGPVWSAIAVAQQATSVASTAPAAWVLLADVLIRSARLVPSVLEKGTSFRRLRTPCGAPWHSMPSTPRRAWPSGRFLVMRAYRNGDDPAPGMAELQGVIDRIALPAQGHNIALVAQAYFFWGWDIGPRATSRLL